MIDGHVNTVRVQTQSSKVSIRTASLHQQRIFNPVRKQTQRTVVGRHGQNTVFGSPCASVDGTGHPAPRLVIVENAWSEHVVAGRIRASHEKVGGDRFFQSSAICSVENGDLMVDQLDKMIWAY